MMEDGDDLHFEAAVFGYESLAASPYKALWIDPGAGLTIEAAVEWWLDRDTSRPGHGPDK